MGKPILKKENSNSFIEANGICILKTLLEESKRIKTYFSENDKTPIFDGFFNYLDSDSTILKKIEVQIKSHEKIKLLTKGEHKGKFKYEFDTAVLNSIKHKITNNPTIYFVVDCQSKKCFFKLIDKDFLINLHYDESKAKTTYYFDGNDAIRDIDDFVLFIEKIYVDELGESNFKSNEEIKIIQVAMNDFYNELNDLSFIKNAIWPDLWKFGIRCSNNVDFSLTNVRTGEKIDPSATAFAIFPIQLGFDRKEICDFYPNKNNLFTTYDLMGKQTPKDYLNDCLSRILNYYFDSGLSIKIMPDICIEELLFSVLDEISKTNQNLVGTCFNECKYNKISIDEIEEILKPYLKARDYIFSRNINAISDSFVIKFFFNPFLDYNNFGMICLAEELIKECKNRNKITIERVWDYFVTQERTGLVNFRDEYFDEEKIQSSVQKLFDLLISCTNEVFESLPTINNPLCQSYYYDFRLDYDLAFPSFMMTMALADEDCTPSFTKKPIKPFKECGYKWESWGVTFSNLFWSKTPLFNLVRVVVHYAICKKYNVKYDPIVVDNIKMEYPFFDKTN